MRQREDGVEVRRIEQIRLLTLQPRPCEPALATRAMAVATAAWDEVDRAAEAAFVLGVTEFAGAALQQRAQDALLLGGHAVGLEVRAETGAEDRAELARRRRWFAAHGVAAGGGSSSSGLGMRPSRPAVTCKYRAVVVRLVCPSSRWTAVISTEPSSRCVAYEWRSE